MQWLVDVFEGTPSTEAAQHLQAAFIKWARSAGHTHDATGRRRPTFPDLARCLGLPANPDAAMLRLRDWHLLQASELVGCDCTQRWQRAKRLHAAAQQFMGRAWPCWWELKAPPGTCHQGGGAAVARCPRRIGKPATNGATVRANYREAVKRVHGFASRVAPDDWDTTNPHWS